MIGGMVQLNEIKRCKRHRPECCNDTKPFGGELPWDLSCITQFDEVRSRD